MTNKLDTLVENFLNPPTKKTEQISIADLVSLIGEVESTLKSSKILKEQQGGGRFSFSIPIPKLTPTEAWGNPSSQSRMDIDRIFASVVKQGDIKQRIEHVNSFLDPKRAQGKAPGGKINTVLNMLQIIEALQAALNDYNESSAGFVFEGFMAALTGGKQISGRVGGTLPIEDFITGEQGAPKESVSLKLLSPQTGIHGSFTNLIDYLYIRGGSGEPSIKYLIAYKNTEGENVSKLAIFDFVLTRENFVSAMVKSGNQSLFGDGGKQFENHINNWENSGQWRLQMAQILKQTPGYDQRRGMFIKNLDEQGNRKETEEKVKADGKAGYSKRTTAGYRDNLITAAEQAGIAFANNEGNDFEQWFDNNVTDEQLTRIGIDVNNKKTAKTKIQNLKNELKAKFDAASTESVNKLSESYFGDFHLNEKKSLLLEGKGGSGDGGAQWEITGPALTSMKSIINTRFYGEINLSQANIDELTKIYIDKIGDDLMKLLKTTKDFTENIGKYFTAENRTEAISANKTAISQGGQIITSLASDPTGVSSEQQPEK